MAALSLSVHSAITLARISFMYSMNALRGFLMVGFLASFSALDSACVFLRDRQPLLGSACPSPSPTAPAHLHSQASVIGLQILLP